MLPFSAITYSCLLIAKRDLKKSLCPVPEYQCGKYEATASYLSTDMWQLCKPVISVSLNCIVYGNNDISAENLNSTSTFAECFPGHMTDLFYRRGSWVQEIKWFTQDHISYNTGVYMCIHITEEVTIAQRGQLSFWSSCCSRSESKSVPGWLCCYTTQRDFYGLAVFSCFTVSNTAVQWVKNGIFESYKQITLLTTTGWKHPQVDGSQNGNLFGVGIVWTMVLLWIGQKHLIWQIPTHFFPNCDFKWCIWRAGGWLSCLLTYVCKFGDCYV